MAAKKAVLQPAAAAETPYVPTDDDFKLKNSGTIDIDENYASQSYWKDVIAHFFHKKSAVVGMILIILITVFAIVGPGMNSFSYSQQNLATKNFAPRIPGLEKLGIFDGHETMSTSTGSYVVNNYQDNEEYSNLYYWFGSDNFGRDIWTRTWSGTRVSLIIAVAAALIDMIIGMSYGLISG
ncbi:MAG TPA: peptide ABC transporter permease, partial [Lachnospiraceae bacterium]|nr:peptide ABC transporter permease [Lachnospiraceae bacterium]